MKARVLVISLWTMAIVGAVRLFGDAAAPAGVATTVLVAALLLVARSRRRQRHPWHLQGESAFPPGPRRVLLAETGLAGPE